MSEMQIHNQHRLLSNIIALDSAVNAIYLSIENGLISTSKAKDAVNRISIERDNLLKLLPPASLL